MPFTPASPALSQFTVLDLTRVRSGPTAVRQLADWGANVIKVEVPQALAEAEAPGGPRHGPDFQNLHRNKRSLAIDLKRPEGREIFLNLAKKADVIVENFRPTVKKRLGIDYETVRAVNPRIVYASISGFGQDGPYRDRPGLDQIAQGIGGLMSITGLPGQGPVRAGIPIADLTAGLYCAIGILVALLAREQTGEGQWVQTSLLQSQVAMLDFQAARWLLKKEIPQQAGNNHPTSIPTGVFKTADGHINIATMGSELWRRLCETIGASELMDSPDYATMTSRQKNRDALTVEIERRLAKEPSAVWIERLNAAGVPCGPINTIDQVFADEQVRHLKIAQPLNSPALGPIELVGQPVQLSGTPSRLAVAPPEIGEQTDEILAEFGYSADEIATFHKTGVV